MSAIAPARLAPALAAICCDARSRPCSRRAWEISCPITAASSSSVICSLSMRPVYTAILPPGMHQALTSGEVRTLTSHFQSTASLRKTAVCGIRRLAIPRTRSVCLGSRLTLPFGLSLEISCVYCVAAVFSISADDTRMSWLRWTPTVPSSVVVVHATSTVATVIVVAARPMIFRLIGTPRPGSMTSTSRSSARQSRGAFDDTRSLTTRRPRSSMRGKEDVMDRRDILAERPLESGRGFMPGVSINPSRVLFTAGLTGRGPDGNLVAGGMGPQARRTYERLQAILSKADARFDNAIKQLTYV